jgi:AraC-like DNA-binding protein
VKRDWSRWHHGPGGIELLEADFERHVYDRHMHDSYAVGYTLRGVQRFWCRGETYDSTPGRVIAINPGDVHDGRSGSAGGYAYRMCYLPIPLVHDIVSDALERDVTTVDAETPLPNDATLHRDLDGAWRAMVSGPHSLAADERLHRSVAALARTAGRRLPSSAATDEPALSRVRDFLHAHLHTAVSVRELAALASLSRFQLSRQFQRLYGLPLHAYHLHVRLAESKRQLRAGTPIASVAADLGFADQSHFHRRFRRCFGVTPAEWRRTTIQDGSHESS